MVEAVFLDFYETIVHEDGEVIKKISQEILETGRAKSTSEIDAFWWKEFQGSFMAAFGETFERQRILEYQSLAKTISRFGSSADARALSELMFAHWRKPPIFPESKQFFEECPVPIYIVSNIDREDIAAAISFHRFTPAGVYTSEDAKSYKPRKELFELALRESGLEPDQVLHIGDSLSSDVKGGSDVGIRVIWVNRGNKPIPEGVISVRNLLEVLGTESFKL
ncbi:MAG: HAD family hydrolase [Lachnospiraceae bacterium]|nr:HAD family hydrolase [Lachnospiraceae bacterium]